jgi:predicted  nucleic acid-binding Zn-ribbon protein/uncharacterized protein YacL (UPF0231 family)
VFHDDVQVSQDAKDFIASLLCERTARLHVADIKQHPFFAGVDWDTIASTTAPFVPDVTSPDDTSYFAIADDEMEAVSIAVPMQRSYRTFQGHHLPFIGYSYHAIDHVVQVETTADAKQSTLLDKKEKQLAELSETIRTLRKNVERLSKSEQEGRADLLAARQNFEKELGLQNEALKEARAANDQLLRQMEKTEREMKGTRRMSSLSVVELHDMTLRNAELDAYIATLVKEKEGLANSQYQLHTQLAQEKDQRAAFQTRLESLQSKHTRTQETLELERAQWMEQVATAESNAALAMAQRETLQAELDQLRMNTNQSVKESEEVHHLHNRLKDEVKAKEAALVEAQTAAHKRKQAELETLQAKQKLEHAIESKASQDIIIQAIQLSLESETRAKADLEMTVQELNERIAELENAEPSEPFIALATQDAQKGIRELQQMVEDLQLRNDELNEMIVKETESRKTLDDLLQQTIASRDALNQQVTQLMQRESDAANVLNALKKQFDERAERDLQHLREADEREMQLLEQYDKMRDDLAKATKENQALKNKVTHKDVEVKTLVKRMDAFGTGFGTIRTRPPVTFSRGTVNKVEQDRLRQVMQMLETAERTISTLEEEKVRLEQDKAKLEQELKDRPPSHVDTPHPHKKKDSKGFASFQLGKLWRMPSTSHTAVDMESFKNGLKGYLKVSLGAAEGTIRKSFKRKFVVVREGKIMVYDKERDADMFQHGEWIADFKDSVFIVRGLTRSDWHNATNKELDTIFMVRVSQIGPVDVNKRRSSVESGTHDLTMIDMSVLDKQLNKLEHDISEEEKKRKAAQEFMTMSNDRSSRDYRVAVKQYEEATARISDYQKQVTKLKTLKLDKSKRKSFASGLLGGFGQAKKKAIKEEVEGEAIQGHVLVNRTDATVPTECLVCHQTIWHQHDHLSCTECDYVCHTACKHDISITCTDHQHLFNGHPIYFSASDAKDKLTWLIGLDHFYTLLNK